MDTKVNVKIWAVVNTVMVIATIAVNALATLLPLNGMDTGQLSDMYPNLFVPAGFTFSIWAVIYFLLIGFSVYGVVQAFAGKHSAFLATIGAFFLFSSIANMAWIFAWHWTFTGISLLVMLCLLVTLLVIYLRLGIGKEKPALGVRTWVHLTFSVYLGWITVATVANVTAFLVDKGWNAFGLSEEFWAALVIIVASLITIAVIITRRDVGYSLVVIWAFYGIYSKRIGIEAPPDRAVEITALAGLIVIAVVLVLRFFIRPKSRA